MKILGTLNKVVSGAVFESLEACPVERSLNVVQLGNLERPNDSESLAKNHEGNQLNCLL